MLLLFFCCFVDLDAILLKTWMISSQMVQGLVLLGLQGADCQSHHDYRSCRGDCFLATAQTIWRLTDACRLITWQCPHSRLLLMYTRNCCKTHAKSHVCSMFCLGVDTICLLSREHHMLEPHKHAMVYHNSKGNGRWSW